MNHIETIYQQIISAISKNKELLAILIDPDKVTLEMVSELLRKVNNSIVTHIFVGGSTVDEFATEKLVSEIKKYTKLPIILFPGDISQITDQADALLFLSLISGRNPEYLIGKHVASVSKLRQMHLEVIPTGYLLIENGKETAVQKVTDTKPMSKDSVQEIVDTAIAGELLGMKLIYLEAGSGAIHPISSNIISSVQKEIKVPLIVGGGIRSKKQLEDAYASGANLVVIGTAFEENPGFFEELKSYPSRF
ncbi:MAG TPA: geranylgeranylglyceryl/heptaprenylglyceryl phosphate synthase [Xanthomarina sp.]|nr:geranylgeranylglyceryl/heptaprenylglyceryl phosphate synthase [Xanthomarina sp.]